MCRRFYKDYAIEVSKYKLVGDYMIKAFSEEHLADMVRRNISDGRFVVDSYGMEFQVRDNIIVTVFPINDGGTCKKSKRS